MINSTERWLPVVGYHGFYEVSDWGQVRSVSRQTRGPFGVRRLKGRVLKQCLHERRGHRQVKLHVDGLGRTRKVHQLVLEAFVGPRPEGMHGCHNDGVVANNHLGNLRWDTPASNCLDMVLHGTHNKGRRTKCPIEHLLAEPNLIACKARDGYRSCLACDRARSNVRNWRSQRDEFKAVADRHYAIIMSNANDMPTG